MVVEFLVIVCLVFLSFKKKIIFQARNSTPLQTNRRNALAEYAHREFTFANQKIKIHRLSHQEVEVIKNKKLSSARERNNQANGLCRHRGGENLRQTKNDRRRQ